jgi:hypothetical protein
MADGTDLETTEPYRGGGRVTRKRRIEDKQGRVHAIEVPVYGWPVLRLIDAATRLPLAVKVAKIHQHETHFLRALVTQARAHLAGAARLHKVVFDKGFLDGTDLGWLQPRSRLFVVPAQGHMAVTADARAQAVAGEELTMGRRVHTGRHGPGRAAWTERLETEVVGITGLTTDDQDGTSEPRRCHNRRDFPANPIHAVVGRQWKGKNLGPGGKTVFLTNASVATPWRPVADDDERSLIENCCIKAGKRQWDLDHPPQKPERAVRVPVLFTLLMCALATAYRLQCEHDATAGEPVGWQRRRRQRLEQTRDKVIVFARGWYGIFHRAAFALLVGVKLKDVPPSIGTPQDILATYGLPPGIASRLHF